MNKTAKFSTHMNKTTLVASISELSGFPRAISTKVLDALMSSITKALKDGNEARLLLALELLKSTIAQPQRAEIHAPTKPSKSLLKSSQNFVQALC